MLPADRLSFRRAGDEVVPDYLTASDHPWLRDLVDVVSSCVGRRMGDLQARLREPLPHDAPPRRVRMASHLILGAVRTREAAPVVPPRRAREVVFGIASAQRGAWGRDAILAAAADDLGCTPEILLGALLADLPTERIVREVELPGPDELALRTNLALVQGLLRRAVQVRVVACGNARDLVRHVRLRGLLCVARPVADGVELDISGPLTLFRRTTLYGRAQASLVPRLPWCDAFRLEARCVLDGDELSLVLGPRDPVFPAAPPRRFDSRVEAQLARDLQRRFPDWELQREPEPLDADGTLVFPDFALWRRAEPQVRWLVEIVGFWTPDYLRNKLDRLRRSGVRGLVLCIDATLNCADAELPPDARVVRYRRRVDPQALLAVVEQVPDGTRPAVETVSLSVGAMFLDWAGRQHPDVASRTLALRAGDRVRLVEQAGALVVEASGARVAALSRGGRATWAPRLERVREARVRGVVVRRRDQSGLGFRHLLRSESWAVPLLDVTWEPASAEG